MQSKPETTQSSEGTQANRDSAESTQSQWMPVPTQAEERVRFQAQLLNSVEQAIIATDLTGTIFFWNRFAETLPSE